MKRRLSVLYWLIPLLYVAVICLLLYAQFAAKERFEQKVGSLALSGVSSSRGIHELSLKFDLLEVAFSGRKPLVLRTESGEELRPPIRSFSTFPGGIRLQFDGGIRLQFTLEGDLGDRVKVDPYLPDLGFRIESLSFPLQIRGGRAESIPGIPLLSLSAQTGRYFISLPYDGSFDGANQRISVRNHPDEMGILMERIGEGEPDPYLHWFGKDGRLSDEAKYRAQVDSWLERAYTYWKGRPLTAGEAPGHAELLGSVLLSEALKRGEYAALRLPFYQSLLKLKEGRPRLVLPVHTTPYLGGLDLYYQELQRSIPERLEQITASIQRGDREILRTPGLFRFILNHGPFSLTEEVVRLADGVDIASAPLATLLNIADIYTEAGALLGPASSVLPRLATLLNTRLLPAIRRTEQGIFLHEDEEVSLLQNIEAGSILMKAGEIAQRPALVSIGQNLILSCLQFADARGVLPARLTLRSDRVGGPAGRLPPEEIYPLFARPRYLPQEIPLYGQMGPGTWIWTASASTTAEIGPSSSRFTFSFPVGATHYLILQGIKPFRTLQLHGIPWKTDPAYFRYSDGWLYDGTTQTLFLKLTHRYEVEEVLITFP